MDGPATNHEHRRLCDIKKVGFHRNWHTQKLKKSLKKHWTENGFRCRHSGTQLEQPLCAERLQPVIFQCEVVNAGTRDEEREKVKRYKALCNQRGLTFVPIIFTTCGGMGEAFQRHIWHPHWKRVTVEAEDAEMKISERVSRKRKLMWMARFGAEIAKHNALMISRTQNIADCE